MRGRPTVCLLIRENQIRYVKSGTHSSYVIFSGYNTNALSYIYTLRLIGPISYSGECDLMVHPRKCSVMFSRVHFVTFVHVSNMHQDTKSARLIAVCKRLPRTCRIFKVITLIFC